MVEILTELLVTLYNSRKHGPLAKTCCATGGVIVYTKESETEEGATRKRREETKCSVSSVTDSIIFIPDPPTPTHFLKLS